jgi:cytochrome c-type biogenesis protein CcmH
MALVLGGWFFSRTGVHRQAPEVPTVAASGAGKSIALTDAQLERMVTQAASQASANPNDASAWAMQAHSYEMLGKFAEAKQAYAKLAALVPHDAQVLADYADVVGVANGRSLKGESEALLKRALAADPKNLKALMLSATLAVENDDRPGAVALWQRARAVSNDPGLNRQIDQNIASAAEPPAPATGAGSAVAPVAPRARVIAGPAKLSGRVWLAEELVAKTSPEATVFIFARSLQGSRMPVALMRKKVKDLPLEFTLDESMGMVKDVSLANIEAAVIVARVSTRGDVMPQAGDLQGISAPVPVGATGIKLEISEVLK